MLTPESIESETAERKGVGSMLVCEAESMAEVKKIIEGDIYYTAGVVSVRCLFRSGVAIDRALFAAVGSGEDYYLAICPSNAVSVDLSMANVM